jgi:hypothetical protein
MEPRRVVVPRGLVRRGLQTDQGAEALRRPEGQLEHDLSADRAAEDDRPLEPEPLTEGEDQLDVGVGREAILLVLPARGGQRLPVARHVEREDTPGSRDRVVGHEMAELPPVRARRVKAGASPPRPPRSTPGGASAKSTWTAPRDRRARPSACTPAPGAAGRPSRARCAISGRVPPRCAPRRASSSRMSW